MIDPVEFGKQIAAIVKAANAPLLERIEALEKRQPEKGEPGPPGKDAGPVDTKAIASEVLGQLLGGENLDTLVDLHVTRAVEKYFAENPVQHGKDGAPGKDGDRGPQGDRGEKGADGAGIADLLIDRDGNLTATFTDGRIKSLGMVIGKDGAPGRDGKDGADFSDAELDWDGERTLVIRGKGGEIRKRLPVPIDRGYWREGMACEKGDVVTHDGNAWSALRDTKAKPCHENKEDWRLFARKGRDGRDGMDGKPPPGPVKLKGGDDA
jgi:hypothetical protein